jgi:hypothetical protein
VNLGSCSKRNKPRQLYLLWEFTLCLELKKKQKNKRKTRKELAFDKEIEYNKIEYRAEAHVTVNDNWNRYVI